MASYAVVLLLSAVFIPASASDFICHNDSVAIPLDWKCDGMLDCADKSDELASGCQMSNCVSDGRVIYENWKCDGIADCKDASDEWNCANVSRTEMWTCSDGWDMIPSDWKCDGFPDCVDQSDEINCGSAPDSSTENPFGEDVFTCADGKMQIPSEWQCDGVVECEDGSDEDCDVDDFFTCATGEQTIPIDWECDYEADCDDGSDEHDECPPKPITKFECASGNQKIEFNWVCDGTVDCRDGSDERDGTACTSDNAFRCYNGDFVALRYKCDGLIDCPDGSDEIGCPRFPLPKEIDNEFSIGVTQFIRFLNRLQKTRNNYRSIKTNQPLLKSAIVRSVKAFMLAQNYTAMHELRIESMLLENLAETADLQTQMDKVAQELAGMPAKIRAAEKNIASRQNEVNKYNRQIRDLHDQIRRERAKCRAACHIVAKIFSFGLSCPICNLVHSLKDKVRMLRNTLSNVHGYLGRARDNLRQNQQKLQQLQTSEAQLKSGLDAKKKKDKELKATKAALANASVGVKQILKYVTITNSRSDTLDSELEIHLVSLDQLTLKLKAVVENMQENTRLYRKLTSYNVQDLQDKLEILNEIAKDNDCDVFLGLC